MTKQEMDQYLKENKKGILQTVAVTSSVVTALVLASICSKENTVNNIQTTIEMNKENEDNLQKESNQSNKITALGQESDNDDFINLADTNEYKVIKVKEKRQVTLGNGFIYPPTKYYIIKEFKFPYSEKLDIKNLYALVDISTNETVLYRDEDYEVIDENFDLSYVELGSLTDYLVKYDYIKEAYQKNELQTILEKIEKENPNKDKIDFCDTTNLSILELENKDTGKLSWHIVKYWPNPIGKDNDIFYNSLYEDIMKKNPNLSERFVLEVDEAGEVVDEYKNYSYEILGSLTDYLATYNAVQPEYDKKDFNDILDKIKKDRAPAQKELK